MATDPAERFIRDRLKDFRTPWQIDRDRLLYCRNFARLAEVTQVVSADHGYVFHNRLTHSLKVGQLARRIAELLNRNFASEVEQFGGLDPDSAEAAGIAHDIGHPPFGHIAEEVLDKRMQAYGMNEGFEGNAQSFRIVAKLSIGDVNPDDEKLESQPLGLNLTRRTLNGILKYPWLFGEGPKKNKWGAYASEAKAFNFARLGFSFGENIQSLEASIMDIADDITYAAHDLIDFYCAGKIPLERLADRSGGKPTTELQRFFDEVFERNKDRAEFKNRSRAEEAFLNITSYFTCDTKYEGTREQDFALWKSLTVLIAQYVGGIVVGKGESSLAFFENETLRIEIAMLKEVIFHYVIHNTELATAQYGQKRMIETLFDIYADRAEGGVKKSTLWKIFPPVYEDVLELSSTREERFRVVADFISSLTEREVGNLYSMLNERSMPNPTIRSHDS